ncbi:TolC family protein [bacterium]|nr:TolC family protein [bacterium]
MFRLIRLTVLLPLAAVAVSGCNGIAEVDELQYLNETDQVDYYLDQATNIEWPHAEQEQTPEVSLSGSPRTLLELKNDDIHNMTLAEVLRIGLENSRVIRSRNAFLSPGNAVLTNPLNVGSFYDPSIQETGVLFGGRGIEAALSAFDTQLQTTMQWNRNEVVQNNSFSSGGVPAGMARVSDGATLNSSLTKNFGNGGQFALSHNINYLSANQPNQLFPSAYTGVLQATYQHPLLAGSGTEFTQVAGPIANAFGGLTGVTQGVIIARINNDISIAGLEEDLTGLVKDVEDQYWDLYLQYRLYDTLVTTRNSTLRTWRDAKRKLEIGGVRGFSVEDEAQARDGYFQAQARVQQTLSQLYQSEAALRRLIGLPVSDGEIIRPSDEPVTAKLEPDWARAVAEGLTHRVELRRHKWNIKSLELQLDAAKNLVRPRLDFIGGYAVNGFGDNLIDSNDNEFSSVYGNLTGGQNTGWNAGFILQMPIGLRSAQAQVTNIELRLAKARDVLSAQELEIAHELGNAFQQLAEKYVTAQTNFNRRRAAQDRADLVEKKYKVGTQTLDLYLRSLASLADAEVAYFQAIVEYNQSIINLQYRMGTLLPYNQVFMSEGEWDPDAYCDALRRARARTHGLDASKFLHAEPTEFVEFDAHWADGAYHEGVLDPVPADVPSDESAVEAIDPAVSLPSVEDAPQASTPKVNELPEPLPIPDPPARRLAPPAEDNQPLPIVPPGRASARKAVPESESGAPSTAVPELTAPQSETSLKPAVLTPASMQQASGKSAPRSALQPEPQWKPERLPSLEDLTERRSSSKQRPQGWAPTRRQPKADSTAATRNSTKPVAASPTFQSPIKAQPDTLTSVRR